MNEPFPGELEHLSNIEKEYFSKRVQFKINPLTTALIVVDLQNDFVALDARVWIPDALRMIPKVKKLISNCRNLGVKIIYTAHVHHPYAMDRGLMGVFWPGESIIEGTKGAEIFPDIKPMPEDKIVYKHRYSAFFQTDLDLTLRNLGIESVIICGTATNFCCESTARDAFYRDYQVIFLSDLNCTNNKEVHENTLKTLRVGFALVIDSTEMLELLFTSSNKQ